MGEVVFEAGQRWETDHSCGAFIAERVTSDMITRSRRGSYSIDYMASHGKLLAPAPKPRQRWTSKRGEDVWISESGGVIQVQESDGFVRSGGSAAFVADWLMCLGFKCAASDDSCGAERWHAGESNIAHMAALANAVAEVFAAPSREACVRYVDIAVRALRGEPFAKAIQATLISLVGDRISVFPSPNEIMATIDACHAWEHARGQVAPGKRSLNRAETKGLTQLAGLAAWARVGARDACDIGEIVAETYERVRSTC